jgi:hypothetical protein
LCLSKFIDPTYWGDVPMRERRNLKRNEINRLGLLHIDGVRGCHPCMVLNFHRDGAMLHSYTHHAAAPNFELSLDGFETTRHCRVLCGVRFSSEAPHAAA